MTPEEIKKRVLKEAGVTGANYDTCERVYNLTVTLMKSEQDKIDFNVVHMSGCNQQKDYCFCDLEIAKHKADTPSEKLLKVLWDSGISIPEAVQTKEELIAWLLDRIIDKDKEIALMKSQQQEEINKIVVGMKSEQEKDDKIIWDKAWGAGWPDGLREGKHKERQALLEKIDKVVDEWFEKYWSKIYLREDAYQELKQKLREAIGKCVKHSVV
jgi:hypothetical protein